MISIIFTLIVSTTGNETVENFGPTLHNICHTNTTNTWSHISHRSYTPPPHNCSGMVRQEPNRKCEFIVTCHKVWQNSTNERCRHHTTNWKLIYIIQTRGILYYCTKQNTAVWVHDKCYLKNQRVCVYANTVGLITDTIGIPTECNISGLSCRIKCSCKVHQNTIEKLKLQRQTSKRYAQQEPSISLCSDYPIVYFTSTISSLVLVIFLYISVLRHCWPNRMNEARHLQSEKEHTEEFENVQSDHPTSIKNSYSLGEISTPHHTIKEVVEVPEAKHQTTDHQSETPTIEQEAPPELNSVMSQTISYHSDVTQPSVGASANSLTHTKWPIGKKLAAKNGRRSPSSPKMTQITLGSDVPRCENSIQTTTLTRNKDQGNSVSLLSSHQHHHDINENQKITQISLGTSVPHSSNSLQPTKNEKELPSTSNKRPHGITGI